MIAQNLILIRINRASLSDNSDSSETGAAPQGKGRGGINERFHFVV